MEDKSEPYLSRKYGRGIYLIGRLTAVALLLGLMLGVVDLLIISLSAVRGGTLLPTVVGTTNQGDVHLLLLVCAAFAGISVQMLRSTLAFDMNSENGAESNGNLLTLWILSGLVICYLSVSYMALIGIPQFLHVPLFLSRLFAALLFLESVVISSTTFLMLARLLR